MLRYEESAYETGQPVLDKDECSRDWMWVMPAARLFWAAHHDQDRVV